MTCYEAIKELMGEMFETELLDIYNAYCEATDSDGKCVYTMEDFDDIMGCRSPMEIAEMASNSSSFCSGCEFFWINSDDTLESSDFIPDGMIDMENIAHYICKSGNSLGSDEIQEILDGAYEK